MAWIYEESNLVYKAKIAKIQKYWTLVSQVLSSFGVRILEANYGQLQRVQWSAETGPRGCKVTPGSCWGRRCQRLPETSWSCMKGLQGMVLKAAEESWAMQRSQQLYVRDWPYMTTYRSGPSEPRYPLCHNNVIICWPPYLVNTYSIAEKNWLLVFKFTSRTSFRKFKARSIFLEHQNGISNALIP